MKTSSNYSKHKVQNKTTEAFKKLLLKTAHTFLHHRISIYIKIKIKFPDQRFLVKMTCKHFTKPGNSWLSVCVRWLFSPSQNHSSSLLAGWHPQPPSCVHMAPRTWVQQLLLVLDHNFWSQYHQDHQAFYLALLLPSYTFITQLIHVLDLCFCSIQVISVLP